MSGKSETKSISSACDKVNFCVTRRIFLKSTVSAFWLTSLLPVIGCSCLRNKVIARFGIVTDIHYADTETRGTRHYRESASKLEECIELMNDEQVDFIIELGDFKDNDTLKSTTQALQNLQAIESVFQQFHGPGFYVLGNHDLDSNSKEQFFDHVDSTNAFTEGKGYYSFISGRVHCIVLDANFRSNGMEYDHGNFDWKDTNIPENELAWLERELAISTSPVIVFIHQLLDGHGDLFVNNADQVRRILEESGKTVVVFQGHHHFGRYRNIANIHYYTSKAVVEGSGPENNSYEIVEVFADLSMVITGYRKAKSISFEKTLNT